MRIVEVHREDDIAVGIELPAERLVQPQRSDVVARDSSHERSVAHDVAIQLAGHTVPTSASGGSDENDSPRVARTIPRTRRRGSRWHSLGSSCGRRSRAGVTKTRTQARRSHTPVLQQGQSPVPRWSGEDNPTLGATLQRQTCIDRPRNRIARERHVKWMRLYAKQRNL